MTDLSNFVFGVFLVLLSRGGHELGEYGLSVLHLLNGLEARIFRVFSCKLTERGSNR